MRKRRRGVSILTGSKVGIRSGAEETEDLAPPDSKVKTVDRPDIPGKDLRQTLGQDGIAISHIIC